MLANNNLVGEGLVAVPTNRSLGLTYHYRFLRSRVPALGIVWDVVPRSATATPFSS